MVLFLAAVLIAAPQSSLFSQDEEISYVYGEVISVSDETIVIEEVLYDEETGEELAERIEIDIIPDVELENINSVSKLKPGDIVEVTYMESEGRKQADYIYLEIE
jgi:hypothetical protein